MKRKQNSKIHVIPKTELHSLSTHDLNMPMNFVIWRGQEEKVEFLFLNNNYNNYIMILNIIIIENIIIQH